MSDRELYAAVAMAKMPHILTLVDSNLLSPTYGCFDRSFWHYKTSPFPSGMYQECVLVLALSYCHAMPLGERYYRNPRIRDLAIAGIHYAARSSHRDGSCDDYFPYERALGAAAFSLYGCTESYLLLELDDQSMVDFFRKRARWLMSYEESGRLSNHQALAALALYNTFLITSDERFLMGARKRLEVLLSWQHQEGWFQEYDGCDPGYLTATIDFLAKYYFKSRDDSVIGPLKRAVSFASHFMHPDGSYGGQYGSRDTQIFFPHGFELMGRIFPEALHIADLYLSSIRRDTCVHLEDDRLCAHLTYDHMQAYIDFYPDRAGEAARQPTHKGHKWWPGAGLYVYRDERRHAVISVAKGGAIRLYQDGRLKYSDSGLIALLWNGRVVVTHLVDDYGFMLLSEGIQVEGRFGLCRFRAPSVLSNALFHTGMLILGRFFSNMVRKILQRILIIGKRPYKMRFRRTFKFDETNVYISDEIWNPDHRRNSAKVRALFAGVDHTSIYVAMSRCFQESSLSPWVDYGDHLEELNSKGYVKVERIIA
jgi:hypothetical protein